MLERFYEPQSGCVLVDGRPLSHYDHTYFHTKVSLVGQEPVLYARSVGENIACNLQGTTQDDIEAAAKLANAHSFITAMTDGYNTQTGEKGEIQSTIHVVSVTCTKQHKCLNSMACHIINFYAHHLSQVPNCQEVRSNVWPLLVL